MLCIPVQIFPVYVSLHKLQPEMTGSGPEMTRGRSQTTTLQALGLKSWGLNDAYRTLFWLPGFTHAQLMLQKVNLTTKNKLTETKQNAGNGSPKCLF